MPFFRIHGDNVVECETALLVIAESLQQKLGVGYKKEVAESSAVAPIFELRFDNGETFTFQFFPGHNRWDVSLADFIKSRGAPLRESVDAFVTELESDNEIPILAFEFCSALPAGNNAWQRTGRALAMAKANIPYIYFADIGGQELDASRKVIAPRFPNPLVPFSYISLASESTKCLTVYRPSLSIDESTYSLFKDSFADDGYHTVIAELILKNDDNQDVPFVNKSKSSKFVLDLVKKRSGNNSHSLESWQEMLLAAENAKPILPIVKKSNLSWAKKISIPSNPSLPTLITLLQKYGAVALGSKDMPFCIIDKKQRADLSSDIKKLYTHLSDEFIGWLENKDKDLVFTFIAGFKPKGDDSRPDRGLLPLANMTLINDEAEYLSVIYGPAKPNTWKALQTNKDKLKNTNGLWESVLNLSDGLIVDSKTYPQDTPNGFVVNRLEDRGTSTQKLAAFSNTPNYGEHDVDTLIHLIFSNSESEGVFEALCNPPGGDWSGISILDSQSNTNRWTSLPRVTGIDGKRPDHIVQFLNDPKLILSIESKDISSNLDDNIGPRLSNYTKELLTNGIAQSRRLKDSLKWEQLVDTKVLKDTIAEYEFVNSVAFIKRQNDKLEDIINEARTDLLFAIEFGGELTKVYVIFTNHALERQIREYFERIAQKLEKLGVQVNFTN